MVFGLNDKQQQIMAYLYNLKDTPESPADQRLSVRLIATHLGMTQQEVKKQIQPLTTKGYAHWFIDQRIRYCKLLPRGIREIEKRIQKETEFDIGIENMRLKRKKTEFL